MSKLGLTDMRMTLSTWKSMALRCSCCSICCIPHMTSSATWFNLEVSSFLTVKLKFLVKVGNPLTNLESYWHYRSDQDRGQITKLWCQDYLPVLSGTKATQHLSRSRNISKFEGHNGIFKTARNVSLKDTRWPTSLQSLVAVLVLVNNITNFSDNSLMPTRGYGQRWWWWSCSSKTRSFTRQCPLRSMCRMRTSNSSGSNGGSIWSRIIWYIWLYRHCWHCWRIIYIIWLSN